MADLIPWLEAQLKLPPNSIQSAIELLDQDNTIPFIARYRKEATGGLDEESLRQIKRLTGQFRALEDRRATVLASIADQGALTPALETAIRKAATRTTLEDLYLPYRPKRKTRASLARDRGLQGLAELILAQNPAKVDLNTLVRPYFSDEIQDPEAAWDGARDIVAETISDHPAVRGILRAKAEKWGLLRGELRTGAEDPKGTYQLYYEFSIRVDQARPHQVLALNRGEAEKILRVRVDIPERDWREAITREFRPHTKSPLAGQLQAAIKDAAARLLLPAIERDLRRSLTDRAEIHAIQVFGENLKGLLNQPPLPDHTILGIDPAYRTGCKLAVIDSTGRVLDTGTIYPHPPQRQRGEALNRLTVLCQTHGVSLIAVGNGTASRETERLVAELIQTWEKWGAGAPSGGPPPQYLIVNEAGASVYSASPLARKELPDLDVSLRGAVSIARRVQDPLAELVKIDPQAIGVGLYQHDVDQRLLAETLGGVVEDVVNQVGVDVNLASPALLAHVAGIGAGLADRVVAYRDTHGRFPDRQSLLDVPGLGPKAFKQAAGFLRVPGGQNPLDNTGVHPESYPVVENLLGAIQDTGKTWAETVRLDNLHRHIPRYRERFEDLGELAGWLQVGELTLIDILDELEKPGRDPRKDLPAPALRQDVLSMEDLQVDMQLKGTVRNVVDFGAFVDIGVKQDGLLHASKIPRGKILSVGEVITVRILRLDPERGRIGLGLVKPS